MALKDGVIDDPQELKGTSWVRSNSRFRCTVTSVLKASEQDEDHFVVGAEGGETWVVGLKDADRNLMTVPLEKMLREWHYLPNGLNGERIRVFSDSMLEAAVATPLGVSGRLRKSSLAA